MNMGSAVSSPLFLTTMLLIRSLLVVNKAIERWKSVGVDANEEPSDGGGAVLSEDLLKVGVFCIGNSPLTSGFDRYTLGLLYLAPEYGIRVNLDVRTPLIETALLMQRLPHKFMDHNQTGLTDAMHTTQ